MPDFISYEGLIILLFILGVILVIIELLMPGFGVSGTLGIISLVVGLIMAAKVVSINLLMLLIALVFIFIAGSIFWIYKSAVKGGKVSKLLLLHTKTGKEDGFSSTDPYDHLLEKEGVAVTKLRPTGIAEIDGQKYDVVADGEFILEGSPLKVVKVEGFRIVVTKL